MTEDASLCLPPRPLGRLPDTRVLPSGTCDTHMHVFGPPEAFPLAAVRNYTPQTAGMDDYRAVMAALGIDRAVLVQPSVYGTDNSALLSALASAPERLRGVVVVPADVDTATLRTLHAQGVRGIRINRRNPGGLTLADMAALAARIAPFGWHIQLQIAIAAGLALAPLVDACPVPVVLDHFGFLDPALPVTNPHFAEVLDLLAGGNLWVKLSAPYRISRRGIAHRYDDLLPFVKALAAIRPDRLLWATDWPHTELWHDMPDDLDCALRLGLDTAPATLRKQIFVRNPAELYGFG